MLQILNNLIQIFGPKIEVITYEDFLKLSYIEKQKVFYSIAKKRNYKLKFNDFYLIPNKISRIHCNTESTVLVIFFETKKSDLEKYKAKFDNAKVELLKNQNSILSTDMFVFSNEKYVLKITYTIMPNQDVIEFLYLTSQLMKI